MLLRGTPSIPRGGTAIDNQYSSHIHKIVPTKEKFDRPRSVGHTLYAPSIPLVIMNTVVIIFLRLSERMTDRLTDEQIIEAFSLQACPKN